MGKMPFNALIHGWIFGHGMRKVPRFVDCGFLHFMLFCRTRLVGMQFSATSLCVVFNTIQRCSVTASEHVTPRTNASDCGQAAELRGNILPDVLD
jgi:hypothetical protein